MKKITYALIVASLLGCKPQPPELNLIDNTVEFLMEQDHLEVDSPDGLNSKFISMFMAQEREWEKKYPTGFERKQTPFVPEFRDRDVWLITPNTVEIRNIDESGRYLIVDSTKDHDSAYVRPLEEPDPTLYKQTVRMVMKCSFKYDEDAWLFKSDVYGCSEGYVLNEQLYLTLVTAFANREL